MVSWVEAINVTLQDARIRQPNIEKTESHSDANVNYIMNSVFLSGYH